ncbi:MAG: helix-turn-helix transcriptional regulator [Tepidisphaeraceae bacterium]
MNTFGQELRSMRMKYRLTLKDVAAAAGRSVSSISDIEHSRRPPLSSEEIDAVCDKFRLTAERDTLHTAACQADGKVKFFAESELEKDLYLTLKRSIDSRLLPEDAIKKLISGLKAQLEAKEKGEAAEGKRSGVN